MNILVVDDSATNRKLLRISLEPEGHTVIEAGDGLEALAMLERHRIDAIISDILMPNMDGYRLCHEVRHNANFKKVAFIHYTSTYTSPGDQKLLEDTGADEYLTKPVSTQKLIAALNESVAKAGERNTSGAQTSDTAFVMKQYSEALVRKLEEKNAELMHVEADLLRANRQLLAQVEKIEKFNTELEQRVHERTAELEATNRQLRQALGEVKELSGLLPICCYCKKIRDSEDYWHNVENYVAKHSKAQFSHSFCPDCFEKVVKPQMEAVVGKEGVQAVTYPTGKNRRQEER